MFIYFLQRDSSLTGEQSLVEIAHFNEKRVESSEDLVLNTSKITYPDFFAGRVIGVLPDGFAIVCDDVCDSCRAFLC